MLAVAEIPTSNSSLLNCEGVLHRFARLGLLLLLFFVFAGGISFLFPLSPLLVYVFYLLTLGALGLCIATDPAVARRLHAVLPYMCWLLAYFLVGMTVSGSSVAISEGIKGLIRNGLVLGAVAVAVERRTLRQFANLAQLAVLLNFLVCLREVADPTLVQAIAFFREPEATAFNVLRPGGLWSNPDEAAFACIFALLLATWASPTLRWSGIVGAVVVLFLGASRTGAYLLLLTGGCLGWHHLRHHGITPRRVAWLWGGALALVVALGSVFAFTSFDPTENFQIRRMFDVSEKMRQTLAPSRIEIALEAAHIALERPWLGHGLFAFQDVPGVPFLLTIQPHNIFLLIWGESGALVLLGYLGIIAACLHGILRHPAAPLDRLTVLLLWVSYLLISVTWHNQINSFPGMLYAGLLWSLPQVIRERAAAIVT